VKRKSTLEVIVPKGVKHFECFSFPSQGNKYPNKETGDVEFTIMIKEHELFKRVGADLKYV